jgi:hypothetical protein
MSNYSFWVDAKGESTMVGSDGVFYIDKRLGNYRAMLVALRHRERYYKNFKHKYDKMNRFTYKGQIIGIEDTKYNWDKIKTLEKQGRI